MPLYQYQIVVYTKIKFFSLYLLYNPWNQGHVSRLVQNYLVPKVS